MTEIKKLVHAHLLDLAPYKPGFQPAESDWIKLNTNEFPYPPPQAVVDAITNEAARLARYPNPTSHLLRQALASHHKVAIEQVIVGNGSDDILNLLARAFGGNSRITAETLPSYSLYPVLTAIAGGEIQSVPFDASFALPVDALVEAGADLLFLTCPNAPTGVRFPVDQLAGLAARMEGLLVIDEAYVEFAEQSAISLLNEFSNVVITRTFSKAYGLAGLRVGYAMAHPDVIDFLDRIRDSYNVNRLSQAGAIAALNCGEFYQNAISEIKATREHVRERLLEAGWDVYPSEANFLFGSPVDRNGRQAAEVAMELFETLKSKRILVRYFPKHPLTAAYLRISIGSPLEMERFLAEVKKWQKNV